MPIILSNPYTLPGTFTISITSPINPMTIQLKGNTNPNVSPFLNGRRIDLEKKI